MKLTIIKFTGEEITEEVDKFELRRNQVTCWYRYTEEVHDIKDVATIKIEDSMK